MRGLAKAKRQYLCDVVNDKYYEVRGNVAKFVALN